MSRTDVAEPRTGDQDVRRAWVSLALFPLSFLGAFGVGEGLASLFGYPTGGSAEVPVWVMFAAAGPALLVFAAPAVLSVVFARRAQRVGNTRGRLPMWLAVALAGGFVLLNVVQGLLVVLLE